MVCYEGEKIKDKLKGIAVEVVYQGQNNTTKQGGGIPLPAVLLFLGALLLLGVKK